MEHEELTAAFERINAGDAIPEVSAAVVARWSQIISRIPKERRNNTAIGINAISAGIDPKDTPTSADQHVAMMFRVWLLQELLDSGALDEVMADNEQRDKVYAAAAAITCGVNDVAEAILPRQLRDNPALASEEFNQQCRDAGLDINRPKILDRLLDWIGSH